MTSPFSRPLRRSRVFWLPALALLLALAAPGVAVPVAALTTPATPPAASPAPEATAAASPAPVPLADLVAAGEAAEAQRRAMETDLDLENAPGAGSAGPTEAEIAKASREFGTRRAETLRLLGAHPSLPLLARQEAQWTRTAETLAGWKTALATRVGRLDAASARLQEMERQWTASREQAIRSAAPKEVLQRVETLLGALRRTGNRAEAQRSLALKLQARVAGEDTRVAEVLGRLRQARNEAMLGLFVREAGPIWSAVAKPEPGPGGKGGESLARRGQESLSAQAVGLTNYVRGNTGRLLFHAALFALLYVAFRRARGLAAKAEEKVGGDPALQRLRNVARRPVAAALAFSLLASFWIYPQPPRLFQAVAGAAALLPALLLLRGLLRPSLYPLLHVLLAFFVFEGARKLAGALALVSRAMFLVEMLCGLLFVAWLARKAGRVEEGEGLELSPAGRRGLRLAARLASLVFGAALLANAFGYVRLSTLVGGATLGSLQLAVVLAGLVALGDGVLLCALSLPPLAGLGMVRRYRPLLWTRARRLLRGAAFLLWGWLTLRLLAVDGVVMEKARALFHAGEGTASRLPSVGNVLEFGLTIWAAFLLSRLLRFVLEEEVYPRAHLARGLPYAISTMLHYAVLLLGFFLAVCALGIEPTKVTILAGAFGVGLGFGLQNIVNNFVSGLILLFERPVNVGDVVQVADASGVVNQIGIRASVIRTANGSEIIVPNGTFISERVTNWTRSHRQRGMELPVHLAPGCDPACVLGLLKAVAAAHPRVVADPAPNAYFLKMSPTVFEFELRAWARSGEDWSQIRSELAVAVHEALKREGIAPTPAPLVLAAPK